MLAWTGPDPSVDAASARSWMTLENISAASPALIAILNNQEYLCHQVAKLTEKVADLKVGPSSRRSSASSRKSGDSTITNLIDNEAVDSFFADEDLFTIFEAFVSETGTPSTFARERRPSNETDARLLSLEDQDVIRLYTCLSATHRERNTKGKAKKSVVQTRTESFQTAIDGDMPKMRF
ncbi:hypothetical protein FPANT_10904 [Fusarium pseudoanthophilum]|uniref:Uncharacterized protein n=1 Tax=Fusarium pseudoanthophilum TaxID=48495 RepID=A0A8H5KQ26_9HYPO|nr:hypothetical protein FPANT_10904 [Fusarium pseudoanthophilum]